MRANVRRLQVRLFLIFLIHFFLIAHLSASGRAHSGAVYRVAWAHPEFGQIVASCSYDKTVSGILNIIFIGR
jgi:hypothetical protein